MTSRPVSQHKTKGNCVKVTLPRTELFLRRGILLRRSDSRRLPSTVKECSMLLVRIGSGRHKRHMNVRRSKKKDSFAKMLLGWHSVLMKKIPMTLTLRTRTKTPHHRQLQKMKETLFSGRAPNYAF